MLINTWLYIIKATLISLSLYTYLTLLHPLQAPIQATLGCLMHDQPLFHIEVYVQGPLLHLCTDRLDLFEQGLVCQCLELSADNGFLCALSTLALLAGRMVNETHTRLAITGDMCLITVTMDPHPSPTDHSDKGYGSPCARGRASGAVGCARSGSRAAASGPPAPSASACWWALCARKGVFACTCYGHT